MSFEILEAVGILTSISAPTQRELVPLQVWHMSLIMEDRNIREAYEAAVAELPATASRDMNL